MHENKPKLVQVHNNWLPEWAYSKDELESIKKNHIVDDDGYYELVLVEKTEYFNNLPSPL